MTDRLADEIPVGEHTWVAVNLETGERTTGTASTVRFGPGGRLAEQATAADVRRLIAAHVAELTRRAVHACPDCDAPGGADCGRYRDDPDD